MLDNPKRVFGILAALALLFIALHGFGSSGTVEGGPGLGQRVANVSTPLLELTILAMIIYGIIYLVRRRRSGKDVKTP